VPDASQGAGYLLLSISASASGEAWVAGYSGSDTGTFAAPVPVVPGVIGDTVPTAQIAIQLAGLDSGSVVNTTLCDVSRNGMVVNTAPAPGGQIPLGRPVTVQVCHPYVTVPGVLTYDDASARNAITSAGLTVGSVTPVSNCSLFAGDVVTQSLSGGASVLRGTAVNLTEASGLTPNGRHCVIQ
jgi:serine/threonine-protein kinase